MGFFGGRRKAGEGQPSDGVVRHHSLTDVIRGLAHAIVSSKQVVEQQAHGTLDHFFEEQTDGSLKPITRRIWISDTHFVDMPLIALMNPQSLHLDEMDVDMSIRLTASSVKDVQQKVREIEGITRSSLQVTLAPRAEAGQRDADILDIRMKFRANDPPEGLVRLIDRLDNIGDLVQTKPPDTPPLPEPSFRPEPPDDGHDFSPTDAPLAPVDDDQENGGHARPTVERKPDAVSDGGEGGVRDDPPIRPFEGLRHRPSELERRDDPAGGEG